MREGGRPADAGYFSEAAVEDPSLGSTLLLVPPNRQKHGTTPTQPLAPPGPEVSATERMRHTLDAAEGRAPYRRRKAIVEPVFGQIIKLFRRGRMLAMA